jgi:hypothetical protein
MTAGAQSRYAKAEPLYKRSLAIDEKALGPDHPAVATSLENYADFLRATGRSADAVYMEVRAKASRAKQE